MDGFNKTLLDLEKNGTWNDAKVTSTGQPKRQINHTRDTNCINLIKPVIDNRKLNTLDGRGTKV